MARKERLRKTYFPIIIRICEGSDKGKLRVMDSPEDIPSGTRFQVCALNDDLGKIVPPDCIYWK